MKTKHTPGPWHADTKKRYLLGGDSVEITLHTEDGMVCDQIASVMIDTGEDSPEDQDRWKQHEANAVLIAAAPDLLYALERNLAHARCYIDLEMFCSECKDCDCDGCTAYELGRAALAKASTPSAA